MKQTFTPLGHELSSRLRRGDQRLEDTAAGLSALKLRPKATVIDVILAMYHSTRSQAANDMSTNIDSVAGLSCEGAPNPSIAPESEPPLIRILGGSSLEALDGQLCGLFGVDITGFNSWWRDDDIQMYIHKSLYEMLEAAFDRSDVPWSGCVHEDRGDGALVVIPPVIPVTGLVTVPDRLRVLVRRHNHLSCDAARVQLRVAIHIGPVRHDGHGFVGHDVNLLFRLLNARSLRRMLTESGAEVAFIASGTTYEQVIRRRPSLVDPALFERLPVRVKETRTCAWAWAPSALPETTTPVLHDVCVGSRLQQLVYTGPRAATTTNIVDGKEKVPRPLADVLRCRVGPLQAQPSITHSSATVVTQRHFTRSEGVSTALPVGEERSG